MLAHPGQPVAPHDLWTAWNLDPLLVMCLLGAAVLYARGRVRGAHRPSDVWRVRSFSVALAVLAIALLSPLEPLAASLASAHMVQHLLLVLVAAPLLALSAPGSTLLRGAPLPIRHAPRSLRGGLPAAALRTVPAHPVVVWLLHAGVLWFWHSARAYEATLRSDVFHGLEHLTFIVTAVLFWRVIIGGRRTRVSPGLGVLLVFGMAMQSVFLAVLLTFASEPWYPSYAAGAPGWSIDPLADQHLAGVIMWVPAGVIYLVVALALLATWLGGIERGESATSRERPGPRPRAGARWG